MPNTQPVLLKVPSSDVLNRLSDGNHKVSYWQDTPPLDLLNQVIERLRPIRSIGPKIWNEPKFADKLSPKLLTNDRRQSLVDGYPLNWLESEASYRVWGQSQLLDLDAEQINVLAAFGNLKDGYVNQSHSEIEIDHVPSPEVQELNQFVFLRQEGVLTIFAKLETQEYEFVRKLDQLFEAMNSALETAITDGRVLIVETENKCDWFVAPASWAGNPVSHSQKAHWFLPMAILDEAWLLNQVVDAQVAKKAKVRHGVDTIETLIDWADRNGKRLTGEDAKQILTRRFGYSDVIVALSWKDPRFEKWKHFGATKQNMKIEPSKIRDIIIGGSPKLPELEYFD